MSFLPCLYREQRRQRGAGGSGGTKAKSSKAAKTSVGDDAPLAVPGMRTVTTKPLVRGQLLALLAFVFLILGPLNHYSRSNRVCP